jgi:cytochrome b pre-mRNA-processing protein 3
MDSEHREMGLGDPTLGRTVRKLVSGLSRRVELWRAAVADGSWVEAARDSVYGSEVAADALEPSAAALRETWSRLDKAGDQALIQGRLS